MHCPCTLTSDHIGLLASIREIGDSAEHGDKTAV